MFIDSAKVFVKAGDGGNGCASFRREKYVPYGGPNGGDGGDGGSVIFRATLSKSTLIDFRYQPHIRAGKGMHGKGSDLHGKNGEDKVLMVPIGTLIYDIEDSSLVCDLDSEGKEFVVARGGRGGRGNTHFKSSTNQAPRNAEKGEPGEEKELRLELKLMADVGLVGFPNAGKSTLISVVSHAHPKIADYPFTTLAPSLGVVDAGDERSFVIADIPGLIEGAHDGTGLGLRFLKHIERTRALLYLVDIMGYDGKTPVEIFRILREELSQYNLELLDKKQMIVINKTDLEPDQKKIAALKKKLKEESGGLKVMDISAVAQKGLKELVREIAKMVVSGRKK